MPPAVDIMGNGSRADLTEAVLFGEVFYFNYSAHDALKGLNLPAEGREVELASQRLGGVEVIQLHCIHKSLLYHTEYKQPDEEGYYHESDAVPKTSCIKTAYAEHGVAKGFYKWGKRIQGDPEPQFFTGDG